MDLVASDMLGVAQREAIVLGLHGKRSQSDRFVKVFAMGGSQTAAVSLEPM